VGDTPGAKTGPRREVTSLLGGTQQGKDLKSRRRKGGKSQKPPYNQEEGLTQKKALSTIGKRNAYPYNKKKRGKKSSN